MNRFIYLYSTLTLAVILCGIGCQSIEGPGQFQSDRDVPEVHASSHREAPAITKASPAAVRHEHSSKYDGRLSRALEPEDIQSSRNKLNQQQQNQKPQNQKQQQN